MKVSASRKIVQLLGWLRANLVGMLLIMAGIGGATYFGPSLVSSKTLAPGRITTSMQKPATAIKTRPLPRSLPTRLIIPKIYVNAPFTQVGLNSDGTMATPYSPEQVGWYKNSPTPGELGPSVVVGHVDYINYGAAVFWNLNKLQPGDLIEVNRADGSIAKFKVTNVQQFPQDSFPTQQVYGNINYAGIRLITCGGMWNNQTHHYSDNVVVFGSLVH